MQEPHIHERFLIITLLLGKISNLNSSRQLREGQQFLLSLQGLPCLQLKIIHMPKQHILGKPVLNPYIIILKLLGERLLRTCIFTDSWAAIRGFTAWSGHWQKGNFMIQGKLLWDASIWRQPAHTCRLWSLIYLCTRTHTHTHTQTHKQTPKAHYNSIADTLSKLHTCSKAPHEPHPRVPDIALETTIPPEMPYPLADQDHITSGHQVVTDWANRHSIFLTPVLDKMVAGNCPFCSQTKLWEAPRWRRVPWGDRPYCYGN